MKNKVGAFSIGSLLYFVWNGPPWFKSCLHGTCVDPVSFVRGGPNLITFFLSCFGDRGSKYPYKWVIIGPTKRYVSLAGRCWPNMNCWLGSFVIFQGTRSIIEKKPYIFVIFRGRGVWTPVPHSGSTHGVCQKLRRLARILKVSILQVPW